MSKYDISPLGVQSVLQKVQALPQVKQAKPLKF